MGTKVVNRAVHDTTATLAELLDRFESKRRPIRVNFRELVSWIPYSSDRYTHLLHPYPAKVIPHIPHFFLSNSLLSGPGEVVLDPFCGTGTVLLEACLHGRNGLGCDSNPLARLISKAKVSAIDPRVLNRHQRQFVRDLASAEPVAIPDVVNLKYWFYPHVIRDLCRLLGCIQRLPQGPVQDLWLVSFSVCVRKTSLTDPRVSVPVRLNPLRYSKSNGLREKGELHMRRLRNVDVTSSFLEILTENIRRVESLYNARQSLGKVTALYTNACADGRDSISAIPKGSVTLIITSPPYLGAQKYVRATSLSLGWLSLCPANRLRQLEDTCIGREHFRKVGRSSSFNTGIPEADRMLRSVHKANPLRSHIASEYLREMSEAISQFARVLSKNGHVVLVAGANTLCGRCFDTPRFLQQMAESQGFVTKLILLDDIRSRGLMTKRNKTAGLIPAEKVILFKNGS